MTTQTPLCVGEQPYQGEKVDHMRMKKLQLGMIAVCLACGISAHAGFVFLDFQDLSNESAIPTGYGGFTWGGDWQVGVEGNNVYVFSLDQSATISRADGGSFSLEGAAFATLPLELAGSLTVTAGDATLATGNLTTSFSTFSTTSFVNIDKLTFAGSGWRMDNFADSMGVPEPTTVVAGALLLLPFGAHTLRMIRKNRAA